MRMERGREEVSRLDPLKERRMNMNNGSSESMPCPRCGKMHERGEYVPRPECATKPLGKVMEKSSKKWGFEVRENTPIGPKDVQCDCGATLRHTVPIFCVSIYGWHWRIL